MLDNQQIITFREINSLLENVNNRTWDFNLLIPICYNIHPKVVKFDEFSLVTSDFSTEHYGINCLYPPLPNDPEYIISDTDIKFALDYLECENSHPLGGIFCIQDSLFKTLSSNKYAIYEYFPEYIYNVDEQINLSGGRFKSIRRVINQFKKNTFHIEELNRVQHLVDCMILSEQKPLFEQSLYDAIIKYDDLKKIDTSLYGFVVKINEKIVGLSINSMHNNTAYNLIRRVDHTIDGITEFLNLSMLQYYRNINPNLTLFNDGDDGNFKGLNAYKVKMKPIRMEKIFEIYKKEIPLESCVKESEK